MSKRQSRLPAVHDEIRSVKLDRSSVDADSRQFTGHAAVYEQRAAIGNPLAWGFYEQVARGAFDKSLSDGDVLQLADHDPAKPIARMSAGTLDLESDDTGLLVESEIVRTSYGNDLIANVKAGNITGMSFGFQTVSDDWTTETVETKDGMSVEVELRTLLEVKLIEVSTTPFPAYAGTDAGLRAIRAARQSVRARGGSQVLEVSDAELRALGAELRVGATLSAATLETLQTVMDCLTTADNCTDMAIPMLAMLMGIDNPDMGDDDKGDMAESKGGFPLDLAIRHRALAEQFGLTLAS